MSLIKRFTEVKELENHLLEIRKFGTIGFVPTMGALHEGHLSLVDRALSECDYAVISIFVNPKQFNNADDLKNYPRTIDKDIELLEGRELIVFHPTYDEIYPVNFESFKLDIGPIVNVMEGKFRPGHFDGVITVVSRLFDIVQPNRAYFGEKDYQQLAVLRRMVDLQNRNLTIVPCSIHRDAKGLALSSRNALLSEAGLNKADEINLILKKASELVSTNPPSEVKKVIFQEFETKGFDPEYVEIVHPLTLESLDKEWVQGSRIFVACFVEKVRLIDNIEVV